MKHKTLIDPVAFLQIHISRLYMERHGLSPEEFLERDAKKDILGFFGLVMNHFTLQVTTV